MLDVCEFALGKGMSSGADEVEVYAESNRVIKITIQNNSIDLARNDINEGIGVRVFRNYGLGFASCNSLLDSDIISAVKNAVMLASRAPQDDKNSLPEPVKTEELSLFDPEAESFDMEKGLGLALGLIESAREDKRVSIDTGEFTAVIRRRAIVNSKGVREEEVSNYFIYYIMGIAREREIVSSFDFEFDATRYVKEINVEELGKSLSEKVLSSLGAEKGKSFKGSILLSPNAVHSLLIRPLVFALNANYVQKGMSRFAGKLGSRVTSTLFNLIDDGTIEGGIGSEVFDREGMPHKRINLIENGILQSFMYNVYAAKREGKETTGHAQGGPRSIPGIGPTNVIVESGEISKEDIIKGIEQGVLVTRFSGFPNLITGDFSGVVKGGFLIEGGKIVKPLIGTLISGNILSGLNEISAISKESKKLGNFFLPYIRFDNISVISK